MKWFFIIGCPRSGTTMLQQALNRHPLVVIPPETAFFTLLGLSHRRQQVHLRRIQHDLSIDLVMLSRRVAGREAGRSLFEGIARAYLSRLGRCDVTHFGEKSPEHLRRFRSIRAVFPEAKMILVYRDGRDVALSLSRVPWMPPDLYLGFALWLHYARIARRAVAECGPQLHLVRYEDLVRDPERELGELCRFLGLDFRSEVARGSGNAEGIPRWEWGWKGRATETISDSRVGVWESELAPEQVALLERWGGRDLESLGYELVSKTSRRLPPVFFARLYWRAARWLVARPDFGNVDYSHTDPSPDSDLSPAAVGRCEQGEGGRT